MINTNTNELQQADAIRENILQRFRQIVKEYIADKPMFKPSDINLYFYDSYSFATNVSVPSTLHLYITFKQTKNITVTTLTNKNKTTDIVEELYLPLAQIKEDLYQICLSVFSNQILVGKTKHGIVLESHEDMTDMMFFVKIFPSIEYKNQNGISGALYYAEPNNQVILDYPKLALQNWQAKNKATNNGATQYAVLFKNLFMQKKSIGQLPTEIFETLVYNVPNKMLMTQDLNQAKEIIDYLKKSPKREMITIDEQDAAFATSYRAFSILYVKHAISQIQKQLNDML